MKYIKQFMIIVFISFIGELLNFLIPLPIPASIYGIVIMFAALELKILKLSSVSETGKFLIEIMPVMFVPAAVGLLDSWNILKPSWIYYLVITVVTTFVVMVVSGLVTQALIKKSEKGEDNND